MNKNYFDESGNLVNVENKSLAEIYMDGANQNRWIPYSEKRPDLCGEYLTYNAENGAMYVLSFSPADNTFGIYDSNVTHWMSLPEPPEKEWNDDI